MVSFLLTLIVLAVLVWAVHLVLDMLTLPPQIKTLSLVIVGLVVLYVLLGMLGIVPPTQFGNLPLACR